MNSVKDSIEFVMSSGWEFISNLDQYWFSFSWSTGEEWSHRIEIAVLGSIMEEDRRPPKKVQLAPKKVQLA